MKLVIQSMSRVWGGNEKWFAIVAKGLVSRGHEVVVSCPDGPVRQRLQKAGLRTSGFRPRGVADPVSGLTFAAWLAFEKPDAILSTSWQSVTWVAAAARAAKVPRVVVRLGIVRKAPGLGPRSLAFRRSVDALIVNAPEIRDEWLRTSPGFAAEKIHLILNGVEQQVRPREILRERLRSELALPSNAFVVSGAGNISERKGFDITLRAVAQLGMRQVHLVIIGDGPYRDTLMSLSAELGISERVHWLRRRDDAADVIAGTDVFVLSSRNEGMANVMLEAMAARVPVIGTDVSGVRVALGPTDDRQRAGWIVPPDDHQALSAMLSSVAQNICAESPEVDAVISEARWRIESWFEPGRMIDQAEAAIFGAGAVGVAARA